LEFSQVSFATPDLLIQGPSATLQQQAPGKEKSKKEPSREIYFLQVGEIVLWFTRFLSWKIDLFAGILSLENSTV
jgi:hypothetical protein